MSAPSCYDEATVPKSDSDQAVLNLKQRLGKIGATVRHWQAVAEQRRQLKMLVEDTDFLKDIGVSPGDAMIEANKPFWKE